MSDWDDWLRDAEDDDLLQYSIEQEKKIRRAQPGGSGGCGSGCVMAVLLVGAVVVLLGVIVSIF